MLRNEGLLALLRGEGIRFSSTPQRGALATRALELVQLARESDHDRAELLDPIESLP
jgi:hypothetical protein